MTLAPTMTFSDQRHIKTEKTLFFILVTFCTFLTFLKLLISTLYTSMVWFVINSLLQSSRLYANIQIILTCAVNCKVVSLVSRKQLNKN